VTNPPPDFTHAPYPPPQRPPAPQYAPGGYIPPAPPQQPYAQPASQQPQYVVIQQGGQFPSQAITKTRRPFNHSKHIMWTVLTGGMWGFGYLWLWAWNKYGPEKAVSVTKYQ
jgi:hypothetical protein